jgi:3'-phosphoadenosine 5'-phosphosulfate (PAPS) 3'-phosphatase/thiamine kinase-like enzyme
VLKEGGEIKSIVTQADFDAQARIIGGLRQAWGDDLLIIGEEDEEDAKPNLEGVPLDKSILTQLNDKLIDEEIPIEDIALFVDPLDGTREFVEGRLHNVACLIGITRKNRPIAGVIGLPFPEGGVDVPVRAHYAIAEQSGSAGSWPGQAACSDTNSPVSDTITILTGDSKDPVLRNATACAKALIDNPNHVLVGGTAAKLRIVATQPNSLAVLHFKTELWDTCSPQALIESNGGKITDLFGSPLVHSPDRPFGNIFGVVASSGEPGVTNVHDDLCAKMRADVESVHTIFGKWLGPTVPTEPQAMDVARDLDGIPLSIQDLEKRILGDQAGKIAKLKSYSVSEEGAWRGMMSNGGRFHLEWEDLGSKDPLPSSVFYKRIVMADLAHARDKLTSAPHKLVRDVKSYQVETSFLTGAACKSLIEDTGLRINSVYGSDLRPVAEELGPKHQLESRFSVLLEDFDSADGWQQQWLLDEAATRAALRAFAKMHAYFWVGSDFWKKEGGKPGEELNRSVWKNGGYMQPNLQGLEQLEKIAEGWEKRYPTFKDALTKIPELNEVADLSNLGTRLEKVAAVVGEKAHPFGTASTEYDSYRTLIHGDPKQANIFLRATDGEDLQVGLIDFQWSGFGLAATDIAHHLSAAVLPSCVSYDGEKENSLLDFYYESLASDFVEYGVAASVEEVETRVFPRRVLQEQYEIALLDVSRMVFAYAWRRWKEETKPTPESLNRNAYNKSFDSALWLVCRCQSILELHEARLAEQAGQEGA